MVVINITKILHLFTTLCLLLVAITFFIEVGYRKKNDKDSIQNRDKLRFGKPVLGSNYKKCTKYYDDGAMHLGDSAYDPIEMVKLSKDGQFVHCTNEFWYWNCSRITFGIFTCLMAIFEVLLAFKETEDLVNFAAGTWMRV
uniref:Uncharacterized protein n=1 Tax=Coptotermes formosanus TaxID=36987 RepID=R4UJ91_COPFO|nr:hypothetical protein [Coptotermes formosanus]